MVLLDIVSKLDLETLVWILSHISGSIAVAIHSTATWLAQLVERQSAVREVEGSSPRLDQHSGS